ncbi:MAG: disulfide bond formation protein B [Burkholderiales bacterium]|nr:disulfide bond formation protein B [Burkholderiales bacterium]
MQHPSSRALFFAGFAVCSGLIAFAIYLEKVVGLEPCPLCMLQRVAFVVLGLVLLAGALHGPAHAGTRIYAGIATIAALVGAGLAARHVWLQFNPAPAVSCAGDFYSQLERLPVGRLIANALRATGDCAKIDWTFLSLSIAEWSLVWFVIFVVAMLAMAAGRLGKAAL